MRRKLTTPDTWNVIAVVIAIVVIVIGATWFWNSGSSTSQEAFVVRTSDGKVLVTPEEWAKTQANNARFAELFPGHEQTLDALVTDRLEAAEAERRGTACATDESTIKLKEGNDSLLTIGDAGLKVALFNVESSGHAPVGYSLTPEAERSPSLTDALKAMESDPAVIEEFRRQCSIGRLYASLAPDGDVQKQNEAISALRSELRVSAGLEYGSAATPEAQ